MFLLVVGQELVGGVECNAGIALDVDNVCNLDLRRTFNRVYISAQALVEVRLRWHSKNCNRAFAFEFLGQAVVLSPPCERTISISRFSRA